MKRIIRQATVFLVLLLIVSLIRLPYGSYRNSVLPILKNIASEFNIRSMDVKDVVVSFPCRLTVSDLGMVIPAQRIPVPLFVNRLDGTLSLLSLLLFRTNLDLSGALYSGSLKAALSKGILTSEGNVTAQLNDLKLETHPTLLALGLSGILSGEFEATANSEQLGLQSIDSADLKLHLKDGEFAGGGNFVPLVKLPPISAIKANAEASLKADRLTLNQALLESSLGTAQGSGSMVMNKGNGRVSSGTLEFRITLTPEGTKVLGGYLALGARIPVDNPPSNWKIDIRITNSRSDVSIRPA